MRPSQFEAIRPNLIRAVNAIDADFEHTKLSREISTELASAYDWAAVPEGIPTKDEANETSENYSFTGKPVRSRPMIEFAYPWRRSAEKAAADLKDCGWQKEAKAITETLSELPTGPVDGNQAATLKHQFDAIRAGAERVRTILANCLEKQPPAAMSVPEFKWTPALLEGYVIKLLKELENPTEREAVEWLATESGKRKPSRQTLRKTFSWQILRQKTPKPRTTNEAQSGMSASLNADAALSHEETTNLILDIEAAIQRKLTDEGRHAVVWTLQQAGADEKARNEGIAELIRGFRMSKM